MLGKLKTAVMNTSYLNKKIYELKSDIELGVLPSVEDVEKLLFDFEKANNKRVSILNQMGEDNTSASFMEPIIFKDNGEIIEGQLFGPSEGAIDFIIEQENKSDLFMKQMATYVAICL